MSGGASRGCRWALAVHSNWLGCCVWLRWSAAVRWRGSVGVLLGCLGHADPLFVQCSTCCVGRFSMHQQSCLSVPLPGSALPVSPALCDMRRWLPSLAAHNNCCRQCFTRQPRACHRRRRMPRHGRGTRQRPGCETWSGSWMRRAAAAQAWRCALRCDARAVPAVVVVWLGCCALGALLIGH